MARYERHEALTALHPINRRQIRRSSRRLRYGVAAFSSIIVFGTILLLSAVVIEQKDSARERAWNDTANLSGAFEEQVRRAINGVRSAMSLLKPRLASEGARFDLVDWIGGSPEFAATTVQVSFAGPDGKLLSSSLERNPKAIDLSDREHIRIHLKGRKGLFISKPVVGRVSGQMSIQISERVEDANGRLVGVLVFSLSPDFLTTLHRSVNLGKSGSMILAGTDGIIRASFAGAQKPDHDFAGFPISGLKIFSEATKATAGTYEGASPLNYEPSFFHWRKVAGYPLIVIVGLGKGEIFAVANRTAIMLGILGTVIMILTLAMTLVLNREITRRIHREMALFNESRKLVHANDSLQWRHKQLLATSAELNSERARLERLNKELATAKEQADQANQAKSSLLMNMSHEFRTPMHAILNYTSMGLRKLDSPDLDKLRKYLQNIQISGTRLLGMLNALLDLAKLEFGKFDLRLTRGDLLQVITQSQAELESLFEAKKLHLHLDCTAPGTRATFDNERLTQVFINLFSNAIKFSPPKGTITVRIAPAFQEGGNALHCEVRDEGEGIQDSDLETIFEKFAQCSKSILSSGGSGLGLAICREIVRLHHGKVWAANAEEGGAVFHVLLPADLEATASSQASKPASSAAGAFDISSKLPA